VIAVGSVAAIVLAPLASVPSGPFRLDRIGVLATAFAFAWCGWHLLRHAAGASLEPEGNSQLPTVNAVERVDDDGPPVFSALHRHRRRDARGGKVPAAQVPEEFPDPAREHGELHRPVEDVQVEAVPDEIGGPGAPRSGGGGQIVTGPQARVG
jgi:hypothetical protein